MTTISRTQASLSVSISFAPHLPHCVFFRNPVSVCVTIKRDFLIGSPALQIFLRIFCSFPENITRIRSILAGQLKYIYHFRGILKT